MVSEVSSTTRDGATLPSNTSQAKSMLPTMDYTDSSAKKAPDNHAEGESTEPPPPCYLSFWKVVLLTIALSLTLFCVSLDKTILATAIPRITDQFHSLADVGWYGSSYLLATSSVQLIFGKLYTLYPSKILFMVGVAVFEFGSFISGVAPNSAVLIFGRSIAGVGAACITSGAVVLITHNIPLEKRPIYLGIIGSVHGVASVTGPLLGGVLTDHVSWRWCFFINIPFGVISCLGIYFLVPKWPRKALSGIKENIRELDPIGACLIAAGIICLLLALQQGGSKYPWNDWRIITWFIVAAVLIVLFGFVQSKLRDRATLPPHIIRNRQIIGVSAYMLCTNGGLFIFVYYLPIWFQAVKGVSATESGVMSLPTDLSLTLTTLISGFLVSLTGCSSPFMIASSIIATIGSGMLSTLQPKSGVGMWLGYQILMGFGTGLGSQSAAMVTQTAVQEKDVPIAVAICGFASTMASSIFLVVGQSVFQNRLKHNLAASEPNMDVAALMSGATVLREKVDAQKLPQVIDTYSLALTQTFYVGVAVRALSLLGALAINRRSTEHGALSKDLSGARDATAENQTCDQQSLQHRQ